LYTSTEVDTPRLHTGEQTVRVNASPQLLAAFVPQSHPRGHS